MRFILLQNYGAVGSGPEHVAAIVEFTAAGALNATAREPDYLTTRAARPGASSA